MRYLKLGCVRRRRNSATYFGLVSSCWKPRVARRARSPKRWDDAAHGEYLARPVCTARPGRFGGPTASGPNPRYNADTGRRILAVLERAPPSGFARWTGPLVPPNWATCTNSRSGASARAEDRSRWTQIVVREQRPRVCRQGRRNGRALHGAAREAMVICVDEKPSIQALDRAQGYLRLANGRALTGHSHDYKRNGTSTLFAAFEVATGKVTAIHKKRRRRVEFLDFMNEIVAGLPGKAIHVVLDNLNTHKPKNDRWLKHHANVHFHFRPMRASLARPSRDLVLDPCKASLCMALPSIRTNRSGIKAMHKDSAYGKDWPRRSAAPRRSGDRPRKVVVSANCDRPH